MQVTEVVSAGDFPGGLAEGIREVIGGCTRRRSGHRAPGSGCLCERKVLAQGGLVGGDELVEFYQHLGSVGTFELDLAICDLHGLGLQLVAAFGGPLAQIGGFGSRCGERGPTPAQKDQ